MGGATIGSVGVQIPHFSKVEGTGGTNCSTGGMHVRVFYSLRRFSLTVKASNFSKTMKYQRKFMIPKQLFAVFFCNVFFIVASAVESPMVRACAGFQHYVSVHPYPLS